MQSDAVTQLAACQPHFYQDLSMPQDTRILNISRNTRLKPHQAERRIAEGLAVWVTPSESIRDASLQEVFEHRAAVASTEAPRHLTGAEVVGLRYKRPDSSTWQQDHLDAQNRFNGCLKAAREFSDCQCSWCSALAHRLAAREFAMGCNG